MNKTNTSASAPGAILPHDTVGEIAVRHPHLKVPLAHLGLDYCCGGKKSLAEAVKEAGLDLPTVLADLEKGRLQMPSGAVATDWDKVSVAVLADHILETHHVFLKEQFPRLDGLLGKVEKAHAAEYGEMLSHLRGVYEELRAELEAHLMKEERILFPAIKGIDLFVAGQGPRPFVHCGSIANPIGQMEHEHESADNALVEMRRITEGYRLPAEACRTFVALYEGLQAMEADLHEHIHLENNILFPKSVAREEEMTKMEA